MDKIVGCNAGRFAGIAVVLPLLLAACSGPVTTSERAAPVLAAPAAMSAPAPAGHVLDVTQVASLKTLSADAVVARLGAPDFTRADPPAEIWQYRGSSCVLDVFLYPEDGEMKVMHATTRDRDRVQAPENGCTPFKAGS
jgi:hypothetical protein